MGFAIGLVVGLISGCIPLFTSIFKQQKIGLGFISLFVCAVGGLIGGLLLGIPLAALFTYLVLKKDKIVETNNTTNNAKLNDAPVKTVKTKAAFKNVVIILIVTFVAIFAFGAIMGSINDNSKSTSNSVTQQTQQLLNFSTLDVKALDDATALLITPNSSDGGISVDVSLKNISNYTFNHAYVSFQIEYNNTVYQIPSENILVTKGYEDLDLLNGGTLGPNQQTQTVSFTIALPSDLENILEEKNSLTYTLRMSVDAFGDNSPETKIDKTFNLTSTIPQDNTQSDNTNKS